MLVNFAPLPNLSLPHFFRAVVRPRSPPRTRAHLHAPAPAVALARSALIRACRCSQFIQPRVTGEDLDFMLAEIDRLGCDLTGKPS